MLIDDSNKKQNLTGQLVSHLDLSGDPFSIENSCFFEDAQRKHNIETLRHLAIFGDMVLLLTGEIGAGKTSLIERFVQTEGSELNICVYKNPATFIRNRTSAKTSDRSGSVNHFSKWAKLARVDGESDGRSLTRLIEHCDLTFQSSNKRTLLIIDDADLLSKEELSLYFSIFKSLPIESGVVLLLAGTPKLLRFTSESEELARDEKIHQIQLKPLTNIESIDYIQCRLASVGYNEALSLSDSQRENLAKMGKGLPGRINRFFAYIIFEQGLSEADESSVNPMARKVLFSIAGLMFLSFVLVSYQHGLLDFSSIGAGTVSEEKNSVDSQTNAEKPDLIAAQREARLKMLNLAIKESSPKILAPESQDKANNQHISSDLNVEVSEDAESILKTEPESLQAVNVEHELNQTDVVEPKALTSSIEQREQSPKVKTHVEKTNVIVQHSEDKLGVDKVLTEIASSEADEEQKPVSLQKSLRSKSWVISQASTNYTAQLLGSYNEKTAVQFINNAGELNPELYYLKTLYKGRDWYVVFYGSFSSKKAAQKAILAAPKVVQKQGPWLRQFEGILSTYSK